MMMTIISELGPWLWLVIGLVLLGLELVIPGVFLLWIGIAAVIVGGFSFMLWESVIWPWQVQLILFAILAILSSYLGKRWMENSKKQSDEPLLNQRTQRLIGRIATLEEPISNGRGRIKLDDTLWVIEGPDMPVGGTVKIVSADSNRLTVTST